MGPKKFALVSGIILFVWGLFSFIPSFLSFDDLPALRLETSYGYFLGYFPMNILNKIVTIIFGIAGIWAYSAPFTSLPKSITYSRWLFAVMGVAAILGVIPATQSLFGYMPLFGNEMWLHALFAIAGAYFGFAFPARLEARHHNDFAHGAR